VAASREVEQLADGEAAEDGNGGMAGELAGGRRTRGNMQKTWMVTNNRDTKTRVNM